MAATNAITVSSSPAASIDATPPSYQPVRAMLSSSPLPSPSQLLCGIGSRPTTNRQDASTPAGAVAGFASASTLLNNSRVDDGGVASSGQSLGLVDKFDLSKAIKAASKSRKPKAQPGKMPFRDPPTIDGAFEHQQDATIEPVPERTRALPENSAASDVLAPRKARKKKSKDEGEAQSKIKKPRITKLGSKKDDTKTKKTPQPKKPKLDRSPERLLSEAVAKVAKERATFVSEEMAGLGLEETLQRRADWTPVRDTDGGNGSVEPSIVGELLPTETPDAVKLSKTCFGNLASDYGYTNHMPSIAKMELDIEAVRIKPDGVAIKKRKIELVSGMPGALPVTEKVKKIKSPKKKLQTITAKATAAFIVASEGEVIKPVTEYFMPPPNFTAPTKPTKPKAKVKKTDNALIVLSPETAMTATRNQDFVFGTSSQLVREESPKYIRDFQQALKDSEFTAPLPLERSPSSLPLGFLRPNPIALTPSKNLWSKAARNTDGSLLDAEFVNLADTPQPGKHSNSEASRPSTSLGEKQDGCLNTGNSTNYEALRPSAYSGKKQEVWHDIGDVSSPAKQPTAEFQSKVEQPRIEDEKSLPRSIAEGILKERLIMETPTKTAAASKAAPDQMPNYKGFTDIQLAKAIKLYGFKAIKSRDKRVSMLEMCWESRRQQALQELPANALLPHLGVDPPSDATKPTSPAKKRGRPPKAATKDAVQDMLSDAPPKKPRGRPKKDPSATTPPLKRKQKAPVNEPKEAPADHGDEIYDSTPPNPSPPRRRALSKAARALALSPNSKARLVTEAPANSSGVSKINPEDRARLFAAISHAITAQPPTHDPKNPSWREKMLMYEPIVIEDLANWLKAEGLEKVDKADKIWFPLVKEWCEAQSVCCLWKENLRGLPRARW